MKYTLLESVQLLLSSLDSDEVNSISDTVESNQVALLLKSVFYDIASELGLAEHETFFELNASGDADQPTLMTVPSNVIRWDWLEYDNKEAGDTTADYRRVEYTPLDSFLTMQNAIRDNDDTGQMSFTSNSETFETIYSDNKHPQWYTTFDDYTILFDSYDASLDTTLQKSKTRAYGSVYPIFTLSDSFTPDLEPQQFSYYLNKAKVRAFAELKQATNQEAAREAKNQKVRIQKTQRIVTDVPQIMRLQRYGRKGSSSGHIPQYLKQGS